MALSFLGFYCLLVSCVPELLLFIIIIIIIIILYCSYNKNNKNYN
jgi:hypothetical protein